MSDSQSDAMPKRGHVYQVCKEWLVREDCALAYKLQSQEINDFYQGNRYRNEVVRTDFPQALEEQIKEKENAKKANEFTKQFLAKQEEHDKLVAEQIADNLQKSTDINSRDKQQPCQYLNVDGIEIYSDSNLLESYLPPEELEEIKNKFKQEMNDEQLARKLQELEKCDSMVYEKCDRLLAIEAQDKELAKMLHEREKAKAKKAKEKARLRKYQLEKERGCIRHGPILSAQPEFQLPTKQLPVAKQIDQNDYANPKDFIVPRQQVKSFAGHGMQPVLGNASDMKDDDIYTLPINSPTPNTRNSNIYSAKSVESRSVPSCDVLNDFPLDINQSILNTYEYSSDTAPPYMPIQGQRRSNSSDERKKKSKDKCTHQ